MTALALLRIGRLSARSLLGQQSRVSIRSLSCSSCWPTKTLLAVRGRQHAASTAIIPSPREQYSTLPESTPTLSSHAGFLVLARRSLATSANNTNNTLSLIKKLRAQSGAPIVDCKKALLAAEQEKQKQKPETSSTIHQNNNGDGDQEENAILEAALDWLRQHGAAKAAATKVQGRESLQGLVALQIASDLKSAALVKVASETDFAAQSEKFVQLVVQVANAALQVVVSTAVVPPASSSSSSISTNDGNNADNALMMTMIQEIEKLPVEQHPGSRATATTTVKDLLDAAIVAIRENISIAQAQKLENSVDDNDDGSSIWVGYVHNRVHGTNAGTAAAVVQLSIAVDTERRPSRDDLQAIGKKLAMHIVAARPQFLSMDTVPAHVINKEREMIHKQIVEEEEKASSSNSSDSNKKKKSKPPEIIAKIAEGRLRKFLAQVCLMDQNHMIEEENPIVSKSLQQHGVAVKRFETMAIE
jgi:elongation factor Ts